MWKHPLNSSQLLPTETWAPYCLASHVPKKAENPAINSQYRKQLTMGQMLSFWAEFSCELPICVLCRLYILGGGTHQVQLAGFLEWASVQAADNIMGGSHGEGEWDQKRSKGV